jgi:hypothetical protein
MSLPDKLPDVRAAATDLEDAPARERRSQRRRGSGGLAAVMPGIETPHARRFQLFTGVLLALAVVAVAGAFGVAAGGGGSSATETNTWSAFTPSSDGLDTGAGEIADYVGPRYVLPNGQQIVAVTGGPLSIAGHPIRIAVRHSPADGGQIDVLDGGGVLYRLCGLGPKCAIASGKSSSERGLLLYRESLELALYSFHDLRNVDNVVVFQPPKKGEDPAVALHFRRGDVAGQLARPLRATLPNPAPTPDTIDQSPDTPFVQALTFGNVFKFSLTQANQDMSVFLVLDPLRTTS